VARLRVPFSAAGRERLRIGLWAAFVTGLALFAAVVYVSTLSSLRPASFAVPAAIYVTCSGTGAWAFMIFSMAADYRPRLAGHLVASGVFASGCWVLPYCLARETWHLATPAATAIAVFAALGSGVFSFVRTTTSAQRALMWSARRPADRRAARATHDAIQRLLSSRRSSAEEQKTSQLNLARARIALSLGDDAPDGLVRATAELSDLLDKPSDDWLELLGAAVDLVNAVSVRAAKHGDVGGYPRALQLLTVAANHVPADVGAMAVVHERQSDYEAALADRLAPGPAADAHARAAIAEIRAAIAAVTPYLRAAILPGLHAKHGVLVARARTHPDDLETGIGICRTAVKVAGRLPRARTGPERALASLLIDRAYGVADELPPDASQPELATAAAVVRQTLAEAEHLLRHARRHGGFDDRADVTDLLAQARTARAMIMDGRGDDYRAACAWRDAARAVARDDPLDRVRIGQSWVGWAESTQDVTWCAEAYAYLMSVVPSAVAVRYLADERDRMLADLQFTAEEAGYWLAEAGRIGDAAVALELGRAVSLSEVLGRERPDLPAALIQAGRADLLARYRAALDEYRAAAPAPDQDLSSAAQRAWATYDAVVREIAAVVDIDVPGTPLTLAELTLAASDGPLVYLAGATRGGYAIVVSATELPAYWPLPGLARAGVSDQAEAFLREPGPHQVEAVIQWLWNTGIRALSCELPVGALMTIVPVGLLSLLPVHASGGPTAAGQRPADWAYLAELVTVRYAHNARTLLRARDRASRLPRSALALLAVAAPNSDSQQPLRHTVSEIMQIAGRWTRADTVADGEATAVERMMTDHTVWHFACHCQVTPDNILDSALLLTGARLSLRTMMALPPSPRRLAVLSACDTYLSGTHLPDEAMGLPAALLQAGFAGVVASHWRVSDRATALFMIRFHELWYGQGLTPAAALAETQRWLRTATTAELNACLGGAQGPPAGEPPSQCAHRRTAGRYGHPYFWAPFALTGQ
jgi:CHAT domain